MALLDEVVDEFARGVIHLDVECFDTPCEIVEGHNGGDSHQQTECGGHQSFRNTAGDCTDAGSLLGGDLLEGVQNADDGSEQAYEGRRCADGSQNAQASLQLGVDDCFRPLQCATRALNRLFGRLTS